MALLVEYDLQTLVLALILIVVIVSLSRLFSCLHRPILKLLEDKFTDNDLI